MYPESLNSSVYFALRIKPGFFSAYNSLGIVLCAQGKLDEAIDYFRRALQVEPDYAEAHKNLNIALKLQSKTNGAIE